MRDIAVCGKRVSLLNVTEGSDRIIYIHGDASGFSKRFDTLPGFSSVVAFIDDVDWNRELSPWKAKCAFRGGEDFSGGAPQYLDELYRIIIPTVESSLGFTPHSRGIAGYSLAGLFAAWAFTKTDVFDRLASVSGSLWYDGFIDSLKSNQLVRVPDKAYFSVGDREKITKSLRMSAVEDCTEQTVGYFKDSGADVKYKLNRGGHFDNVADRISDGLLFIS